MIYIVKDNNGREVAWVNVPPTLKQITVDKNTLDAIDKFNNKVRAQNAQVLHIHKK